MAPTGAPFSMNYMKGPGGNMGSHPAAELQRAGRAGAGQVHRVLHCADRPVQNLSQSSSHQV